MTSIFKNVTDMVVGSGGEQSVTFWDFAYRNLSQQERERFSTLRHVWTESGKVRALIRALLNERSFERYILIWLNDPNLPNSFEDWSFLRDVEVMNLLPSIAAGKSKCLLHIDIHYGNVNSNYRTRFNTFRNICRQSRIERVISFERNSSGTSDRCTNT